MGPSQLLQIWCGLLEARVSFTLSGEGEPGSPSQGLATAWAAGDRDTARRMGPWRSAQDVEGTDAGARQHHGESAWLTRSQPAWESDSRASPRGERHGGQQSPVLSWEGATLQTHKYTSCGRVRS